MFANLDLAKLTGTVSSGWLEMIVKSLPHLDVFQKNYFSPEKDLLFAMAQRYSAVQFIDNLYNYFPKYVCLSDILNFSQLRAKG